MKTETSLARNSMTRSLLRHGLFLTVLMLACFALPPQARAVCQEGCLTNNNTVLGHDALISLTTGVQNTAIGADALFSNITGYDNTANGYQALYLNTGGWDNTATGNLALFNNTSADNTATGAFALYSNTTGSGNTATGDSALYKNTTGNYDTATGVDALFNNTGDANTATGSTTLLNNTTGYFNTATGSGALQTNTTVYFNTATGVDALHSNTTGYFNTASGEGVLYVNETGINNTAVGYHALFRNITGKGNIALGISAGSNLTDGDNNIDIANPGVAGESKKIHIGKVGTQNGTYIAGISGVTVADGVGVIVGADGHLGTVVSSERYKDSIKPMDKTSEAILALKPVTFRYKHELDPAGIPQFGLVAEEVEKVNPDLVARDGQGKPYTVRYEAVNAMLLNEFLKEHRKVEEQQAAITELKRELQASTARQQKQIDVLTQSLQKVSAQLELTKSAPQTVLNNQ